MNAGHSQKDLGKYAAGRPLWEGGGREGHGVAAHHSSILKHVPSLNSAPQVLPLSVSHRVTKLNRPRYDNVLRSLLQLSYL